MQTIFRSAACLMVAVALGCGGAPKPPPEKPLPPPTVPDDPLTYVPADCPVVGRMDLTSWRKSILWEQFSKLAERAATQAKEADDEFLPLDQTDQLFFGGSPTESDDATVVGVLRGRYGAGFLKARAAQFGMQTGRPDAEVYLRDDSWWMQITDDMLVVATADRVDWVLERARPTRTPPPTAREGALYTAFGERMGFDDGDLVLLMEDKLGRGRKALQDSGRTLGPFDRLVQKVTQGGVRIEADNGLRITGTADMENAEFAAELAKLMEYNLQQWANNPFLAVLGVRELLEAVKVTTEAALVTVQAGLNAEQLDSWVRRLGPMLEQLASGQPVAPLGMGAPPATP